MNSEARRLLNLIVVDSINELVPSKLFHTTSREAAASIMKSGVFQAAPFVSFSEKPWLTDISAAEVVLAIDVVALFYQVERVIYSSRWAKENPDKVTYIAGEGWREQFEYPDHLYEPPEDWDDEEGEWEPEQEDVEHAYAQGKIGSFLSKDDELEWISRIEGQDVVVPVGAISLVETR